MSAEREAGGLKEGNNNGNLHWLLLVKRNKGLVLQIVKSIRSLRESHSLETLLSIPAFNKTSVYCKAKAELPSALTFPPSLSLQSSCHCKAATLSMWNIFGGKIHNEGVELARFPWSGLIQSSRSFILSFFPLFSLGCFFPSSCHTGAPSSTPCF